MTLRRIVGFHQDEEGHWVADLECSHTQHVRHDPPWQVRPWVTTEHGRREFIGATLNCVNCDRGAPTHLGHDVSESRTRRNDDDREAGQDDQA
jgi:hypothetical protein